MAFKYFWKPLLTGWCLLLAHLMTAQSHPTMPGTEFINHPEDSTIEVRIDGAYFTSLLYSRTLEKPILYPLISPQGLTVTRGFPRDPRPGERIDHPHQVGLWFNYGDVNSLDFWNNSSAIPNDQLEQYGKIVLDNYKLVEDQDVPSLTIHCTWQDHAGNGLLREKTIFKIQRLDNANVIDRITTLTAIVEVTMEDNKEGLIGMRVARELELPSDQPAIFTDAQGHATEVKALDNSRVTGNYLSSEGLTGDAVWGTRGRWVRLAGVLEGKPVSIVIIDHPDNVGYPTYWHARGYGLFAANPLGQSVFSSGEQALHFRLSKGSSRTFRYRVAVHDGSVLPTAVIEKWFEDFSRNQ
ncbi:MAG: PmoA family protein [Saprospiraceae bacterium]